MLHALIGVELEKGNDCLDLDKTVGDYGLDEEPPGLTAREKAAMLRQLLQSRRTHRVGSGPPHGV